VSEKSEKGLSSQEAMTGERAEALRGGGGEEGRWLQSLS
jgi:hypothetical protein